MNTISERIKYLLDSNGLSPYSFCKKSGFSEATLSKIFKENRKPNDKNLQILSNYFSVSTFWLLTGNGEMSSNKAAEVGVMTNNVPEIRQEYPKLNNEERVDMLIFQNQKLIQYIGELIHTQQTNAATINQLTAPEGEKKKSQNGMAS